ncbi:MAG: hypothetical protein ACYDCK_12320 [Thermoplasmatota archaeon]
MDGAAARARARVAFSIRDRSGAAVMVTNSNLAHSAILVMDYQRGIVDRFRARPQCCFERARS